MSRLRWFMLMGALVTAVLAGALLYVGLVHVAVGASPDPTLTETRYCGEPKRNLRGDIIRRVAVRDAFLLAHPCPSTGLREGRCDGWQVDHVIPLACGGCDAVSNMQWLPLSLKIAPVIGKDRFERKIYGGYVPTTYCEAPPPGGIK